MAYNSFNGTLAFGTTPALLQFHLVSFLPPFWVVAASGDGVGAFSGVGNVVTHGGAGPGGFDNPHAWIEIRSIDSTRRMVFQRGTVNNQHWRVKYAYSPLLRDTTFITTTRCTSFSHEGFLHGGGTDAAPTYALWFNVSGTFAQIGKDPVSPFPFYVMAYVSSTGVPRGGIVMDSLQPGSYIPGSGLAGDVDPLVIMMGVDGFGPFGSASLSSIGAPNTGGAFGYFQKDPAVDGGFFAQFPLALYQGSGFPAAINRNRYSKYAETAQTFAARNNSAPFPTGVMKGVLEQTRWLGIPRFTSLTYMIGTVRRMIGYGDLLIPFDNWVGRRVVPMGINTWTNTTPVQLSSFNSNHGLLTGDRVYLNLDEVPSIDNQIWTITVTGPNTFTLDGSVAPGFAGSSASLSQVMIMREEGAKFGASPDTVGPLVVGTSPANLAVDVPTNAQMDVFFSEPMNASTLNPGFRVLLGGIPVGGSKSVITPQRWRFNPFGALAASTVYQIEVNTLAQDVAGNPAIPILNSFTTRGPGGPGISTGKLGNLNEGLVG